MIHPGESLDGYRLIRLIGHGGFGQVWLCQSEALGDLRALKLIPAADSGKVQKEFESLSRYRAAASRLRSPSLMPVEHANVCAEGLFYIMPLADGFGAGDPTDPDWQPRTLASVIEEQHAVGTWFSSGDIISTMTPILKAVQMLSDAGLVHRDVKPENILYMNAMPCLGDISLLGNDSRHITRRGTPGYLAPSWYLESGGSPDMFGVATTLYSLLTGNPPDKMGRSAFRWPPQGEASLTASEKERWLRIHGLIRRAVDEHPAERFVDFQAFSDALLSVGDEGPSRSSARATIEASPVVQDSVPSNPGGLTEKELADYTATASLAALYFKEKNYQAALEMLNQLNSSYPVSNAAPCYSTLRAQCFHELGRPEDAHRELRHGLHGKRLDLASFGERMKLWDALGDLQGAEEEVTRIIEESAPITLHYMARIRLRLRRGDFDAAEQDILAASTLDDDPGRVGLAGKLRAGYAEEFPEYARYLDGRGIVAEKA